MKKLIYSLLIASSGFAFAQETTAADTAAVVEVVKDPDWKLTSISSFVGNQSSFTNWQAGGINALSYNAYLDLTADYAKGKYAWDNDLKLGYGKQFQDATQWRKTDDIVHLTSKIGRVLTENKKWYVAALGSFRTQFVEGYEYPKESDRLRTSTWLAPAYVTAGIGLEYKPVKYFSALLTPIATKMTIVNHQGLANEGRFGNEAAVYDEISGELLTKGKKLRTEFGAFLGLQFNKEVIKNVTYKSSLNLFSNYKNNPENIDVIFNNAVVFKVNDILSFSFVLDMIYDDDIKIAQLNEQGVEVAKGARLQVKQLFGFGLSYKLRNFTPKKK